MNYHVVPDKANVVCQNIGVQFAERIILEQQRGDMDMLLGTPSSLNAAGYLFNRITKG